MTCFRSTGLLCAAALAMLAPLPLAAQTSVAGTVSANTTLTAAQNPIQITGQVVVATGVTLTIEPGVEVRAAAGADIRVDGQLVAQGTAADPIRLRSVMLGSASAGSWGGVFFS